jgi:hypothetical protein
MSARRTLKDGQDGVALAIILFILSTNIFLAKIAFPISDTALSVSLLCLYASLLAGVLSGRLLVNPSNFTFYSIMATCLVVISVAPMRMEFSVSSLLLILCLLLPYVFSFPAGAIQHRTAFACYNGLAIVLSIVAIAQFPAQFILGPSVAFWLDYNIPEAIFLKGYNNLNYFEDGSEIIKSNGVFLNEPSSLSQFVCLAIIIELAYFRRLWPIIFYSGAEIVSYSGTGILMLLAVAPILLWRYSWKGRYSWKAIVALAAAGLVGFLFFNELGLGLFVWRSTEFEAPTSSGYARFLGIFRLLADYVWSDAFTTFFGRGPGSVTENFLNLDYGAHDPSWGKIMYEYGLLGSICYFSFFLTSVWRARVDVVVKLAITIQFLFLGGLAGDPAAHAQIVALLIWPHGIVPRKLSDGAPSGRVALVQE